MRHLKKLKKLGLVKSHRVSLLKNLTASLVLNGYVRTTESRAKALAAHVSRMMRFVRNKPLREAIRVLPRYCFTKAAPRKIVTELKIKYEKRVSGFTRLTPIGLRKGDSAKFVQIELI